MTHNRQHRNSQTRGSVTQDFVGRPGTFTARLAHAASTVRAIAFAGMCNLLRKRRHAH